MSLIIATSHIDENTDSQPNEKPSNFTNFYRSAIEIEPNSEIAVQSVKVQRTGNITVGTDDFFAHYFGSSPELINDEESLTCFSRTIKPKRGSYSLVEYDRLIQNTLNEQYDDPRTFGGYLVDTHTNTSGVELGLEIRCIDKGSASGTNVSASLTSVPTFNITNPYSVGEGVIAPSDGFTWTPASGSFTRTADPSTSLRESLGVGILKGAPFGLNQGKFIVELGAAKNAPCAVGLTRPQIQIESYEESLQTDVDARDRTARPLDWNTAPRQAGDTRIINYDETGTMGGTWELYDYAFYFDEDDNITIAERVWDYRTHSVMQEMEYWANSFAGSVGAKLTKTQFNASWDGIMFEGVGDEIELSFKQNGKQVFDKVISSTFANSKGRSFNPIGSTSYALYPQLNILEGTAKVTKYESSNVPNTYKYPTLTTDIPTGQYLAGNDAFSNEALVGQIDAFPWVILSNSLASNSLASLVFLADSSWQKLEHSEISGGYLYSGLNASLGVDFLHQFTIGKVIPDTGWVSTVLPSQERANMSGKLGFVDRAIITSDSPDGYASGDATLNIVFTSTSSIEKTTLASFIRLPGLTHRSYNGAQSGLSKIIYQLPQFSNDGRQFGALYFEANEKTYVKLNNPGSMILNSLNVQIVDSQERELTSLTGDTQIVFHVRKSV